MLLGPCLIRTEPPTPQAQVVDTNVDGTDVRLLVNDTAGQERFDAIVGQYFRGAHGVIVVFDVTDPAGLRDAEAWLTKAQVHCSSNSLPPRMVAVGNKVDLKETRVITSEAAQAWAKDHGMQLLETSAVDGSNVQEAFTTLVRSILADPQLAEATKPHLAKLAAATVTVGPQQGQSSMEGSCCG